MKERKTVQKAPASNNYAQSSLDKAEKDFQKFDESVKEMTLDRMNQAPKLEQEPQTKISNREAQKKEGIWLKPKRTVAPGVNTKTGEREKFNEKFRKDYEFAKEYVKFVAEHKELIGETIEIWTKRFPGTNCEFWEVPTNKPVHGPRYLAEQIKGCTYHRLHMDEQKIASSDGLGTITGSMVVDHTVNRLDANPISDKTSVFMGTSGF